MTGFGVGEPPIEFLAHRQRKGDLGAPEDFEQMLALLVGADSSEEANLIQANPGDWGIDVLVGDLNGRVTIWQSKYFINDFGDSQKGQVRKSFLSAVESARKHGYVIERWVLCIPRSLDPPSHKWWTDWSRRKFAEYHIRCELWDETALRQRLSKPEADHIRRIYYHPYRQKDEVASHPLIAGSATVSDPKWSGGEEIRFGADCYLLFDDAEETFAPDRSWVLREATAERIEPASARVRLRRLRVVRETATAMEWLQAFEAQTRLPGQALAGSYAEPGARTVATLLPPGHTWRQMFGPGETPLDRLSAAAVLAAAADLCDQLAVLHRGGHHHRALSPDSIVVADRSAPRDLGYAALPVRIGEGPALYRAPEQRRMVPHVSPPGAHTDVYQLAAIICHTLTGHPPSAGTTPPMGVLDEVIGRALDPDPHRRPGIRAFANELRRVGR